MLKPEMANIEEVFAVVSEWGLRSASGGKALLCDYTAPPAATKPVTRC